MVLERHPQSVAGLPSSRYLAASMHQRTDALVARAMRFLSEEWLCDVSADYAGKCILIAATLTILERALLPERPAIFVTAGQRGGGKTAATYSDRVLGQNGTRTVPSTTINFFTGNNIAPRGDMASRSLLVRLDVDRPDPEDRDFKLPDPIMWTNDHRGNILAALYTIMLGNPPLRHQPAPAPSTRRRRKPALSSGGTLSARLSSTLPNCPRRTQRRVSRLWSPIDLPARRWRSASARCS
jgi:hypothetical protein